MKMQENTKKRAGAVTAALAITALVLALAAGIVLLIKGEEAAGAGWILGIYAVVLLAAAAGVLAALGQRLREIKSGEEELAKKY